MNCRCRAVIVAVLLATTAACGEPLPVPDPAGVRGESPSTRKRLAEVQKRLVEAREKADPALASEAIEELHRLTDEAGDDLIAVEGGHFHPARWVAQQILCFQILAGLPTKAVEAYRDRIDEPARELLEAGKRDRDPRPLWVLADRFLVARPATEGMLLLGDLLFERGEFRTAELVWRRLLPPTAERFWERLLLEPSDVPYPFPPPDPAAVRARVVLAVIFQGELDRAAGEWVRLAVLHPNATGTFAGKSGAYAEILRAYLDSPPTLPAAGANRSWPTYAGSPDRSGCVPGRMPGYWPARPTWRAEIPGAFATARHPPVRPPFGHPVIVGGQVYVTDGFRVAAIDLLTGATTRLGGPIAAPNLSGHDPCCTLTAAGDRLYARMGPPAVRFADGPRDGEESVIACFAPPPVRNPGDPPLAELWRLRPPTGSSPAVWEGAPLVAGHRMWAVLVRSESGRIVQSVACYDPADPLHAPDRPAWVVEVCDHPPSNGADGRTRQELLTLAGRHIVFCSNGGAVIALDAVTGRRAWAFRYPRSARRASEVNRAADPAPAVAAGGRVFVAPTDADRVFALEEETGRLLWERGPAAGAQILGVARNKLVITVTAPVRGIRGLDVTDGSYLAPRGWEQHSGRGLLSYGRGLVSNDLILWPTYQGLFFLDPEDGRPRRGAGPLRSPLPGTQANYFGNLAYADGVLIVVTPTDVWGYVSDTRRFGNSPRAGVDPRRREFEERIDAAEAQLAVGDRSAARSTLLRVARGDFPPRMRAWAAARLLLLTHPGQHQALPADVRAALSPELHDEWLIAPDGSLVTLGTLAARHAGRTSDPPAFPESPAWPQFPRTSGPPGLHPDATAYRNLPLPCGAFPLRRIPGALAARHAFLATGSDFILVPLGPGEPMTRRDDRFTHAADIPGGFLAAGPHVVAVFTDDPSPVWVFRVPDLDPLPDRPGQLTVRTDDTAPVMELSSFTLANGRLFARLGTRHIVTLDLYGRRVAWVLGSHGRPAFEPAGLPGVPRFGEHFGVCGRFLVVQLSDGHRWTLATGTGQQIIPDGAISTGAAPDTRGAETALAPWTAPPVELAQDRLAVSDGPGTVRVIDPRTDRVKWTFSAGGDSNLAGDPPQVRVWGGTLLVAVRRNIGVEIDRLDPLTGRSVWSEGPLFLEVDRVDLATADADNARLYVAVGGKLCAFSLLNGSTVWEADLPDTHGAGGWMVRAGRRVVIAYPTCAVPSEPVAAVCERAGRSFVGCPLGWRLPALAAAVYDAWVAREVPVVLFHPGKGRQLRQLDLPARGPAVAAWFEPDLAVVATGDRVAWLR